MSDNNRYSGEVYIDQDTDNLFAAFMQNILNVYSGSGKNFDADKLDGRHWDHDPEEGGVEGIKQYIDNKCDEIINFDTTNFLTNIYINGNDGKPDDDEDNEEDPSIVKFNITSSNINISDNLQKNITNSGKLQQDVNISDVDSALSFLYTQYTEVNNNINIEQIKDQIESQTAKEEIKTIADFASFLHSEVKQVKDDVAVIQSDNDIFSKHLKTDNQDEDKTYLNADRIGGYNIIPVTEAKYKELAEIKDTEDNDYKYFHCPNNIFIQSDNVANDNTIDTKCHYDLKDGYEFRVNEQGYLQYKHEWNDVWNNIANLTDILGLTGQSAYSSSFGQAISYLVQQYIQEQVNQGVLDQFIKDQIQERVYTKYINNIQYKNQPLLKKQGSDNYYYIRLDETIDEIIASVNQTITAATDKITNNMDETIETYMNPTISQITKDIQDLQNTVTNLSKDMSDVNTSIQERVTQTCGNQISKLVSDKVHELSRDVKQINSYGADNQGLHWKNIQIASWGIKGQQSSLDYNEDLQLAILHLHTRHRHIKGNKGATVNRYGANGYDPKKLPNDITPVNRIWARLMPSRYVVLETDGSIKFNFEFEPTSETYDVHIDIPFFYNFVDEWL